MATSEGGYQVLFGLDVDPYERPSPGTIVVTPHEEGWNDFGLRVGVRILVGAPIDDPRSDRSLSLEGFFGLVESKRATSDVRALRERLRSGSGLVAADEFPNFFTMLPEIGAYREIVSRLGPNEARAALRALHDVVEAVEGPGVPAWLKPATDSHLFRKAFLRTSEAYFAWKNAGMVLDGVEHEQVGRLSDGLRIRFQLAGRPNEHRLHFRFALHEEILPKRFAVVIGTNGVGKSQTLGRIADAAIRGLPTLTDSANERPTFNRILAFYPTAVAPDAFPPERRRAKVWYRRFSLGGAGYGRRRQTTADLVVELARTGERIADKDRFAIFMDAIRAIEAWEELAVILRDHEEEIVPIGDLLRGNEERRIDRLGSVDPDKEVVRLVDGTPYRLSSGELGFVRFAALASRHIENSSLLLFDEPETHLHPSFISQFVLLLDRLLEQTGSAAIIATHSVYFLREAFEDQVRILRSAADRSIVVERPTMRTFGADVGTISWFVFGEDRPSRLARSVERQITDRSDDWEATFEAFKDDLSLDLLGDIRAEIEDRGASDRS